MIWADPEVTRYIDGEPRSWEKCREAWEFNLAHWREHGFGNWLLWDKQTSELIGQAGFFQKQRDLGPDFDAAVECGWVLASEVFGRGFGTEAVLAAHEWWDRQKFASRTVCMLDPDNMASEKVARRAGYVPLRKTEFSGSDVLLMQRSIPVL